MRQAESYVIYHWHFIYDCQSDRLFIPECKSIVSAIAEIVCSYKTVEWLVRERAVAIEGKRSMRWSIKDFEN